MLMKVKVCYFAQLKVALGGVAEEEVTLPAGATAGDLLSQLEEARPPLRAFAGSLLLARNQQWADPATALADGDEIALMPPLSGG